MTDLELRLFHCEREPSEVALYDAADAFLAVGDDEMYHGLKYMGDKLKFPWISKFTNVYVWFTSNGPDDWIRKYVYKKEWDSSLEIAFHEKDKYGILQSKQCATFAGSVRWLGNRLMELGMA